MRTLEQILIDANAYLDLEATTPSGTEEGIRVNFANQAVLDAAASGQFSEFDSIYEVNPSGNASLSLPTNFVEFTTSPRQALSSGEYEMFDVIHPLERFSKDTSDKYCYILGNPMQGYTAVFNGLTANVTVSMDYQRFPSGLATLADKCELPDPQYVVSKVISYVLQGRSDDRFPIIEADAQRRLQNMLGRESKQVINETRKRGPAGYNMGG